LELQEITPYFLQLSTPHQLMEYRIEASLIVEPNHIAELIISWYRSHSARRAVTPNALRSNRGRVTGQSSYQPFSSLRTGVSSRHRWPGDFTVAERASAALSQRSSATQLVNAFPVATQPAIVQTETSFAIGPAVRLRKLSNLGDLVHDYFFWQQNQVLVLERLSGRYTWKRLKEGWDNPHVANPGPVNLGRFDPNVPMKIPVSAMTDTEKLAEATRRAVPLIKESGTDALAEQIESLTDPETIATMLAIIGVSTVFPVVGVGFAILGVYYLGRDAVSVLENLIDFVKNATNAQTHSDLDKAAENLKVVIVVGGVVVWELLSRKRGKGRKLVKNQPNAGAKSTSVTRTPEVEPIKPGKKEAPGSKKEPEESKPTKKKPLRDQYLGDTPGKKSKTGKQVIDRLRQEKPPRIREKNGKTQFQSRKDGKWYDIENADMAHYPKDAVAYWNTEGKQYGPKSKRVRNWMLNPNNYELEHYSHNRSDGAKLGKNYEPPVKTP